ncbi:hypothetical protein [Phyllobacterium zundukense]|uniref:Uncharacterized protein n=1 Tax=Phyllobacterium zundukense TaxID=1867719 RepID=A0A2N9VTC4_9HYPH|nr:hypothetical protein [Phyllobacterium zundukense]ATU93305.1 hypothetical protein BLM14_18105 [Phyllobacterium zundukense]PIO42742.1 hypothetical protein B5P45_19980 [Phyllobacterium zundukense]
MQLDENPWTVFAADTTLETVVLVRDIGVSDDTVIIDLYARDRSQPDFRRNVKKTLRAIKLAIDDVIDSIDDGKSLRVLIGSDHEGNGLYKVTGTARPLGFERHERYKV